MRRSLAFCIALALGGLPLSAALAASPSTSPIASMPLAQALDQFAHESGWQVVYDAGVSDAMRSTAAPGGIPAEQQLAALLRGTHMTYHFVTPTTVKSPARSSSTRPRARWEAVSSAATAGSSRTGATCWRRSTNS